jgi:site-specific DNA-methyltransferase (adenine-specific)
MIKLINGDCLEKMKDIPDKSIDMILCDLPYGTTACKWDTIIPFEPLWEQYKRIIKDNGAIVLTASQPFTSALVMSNIKMFKYSLVWQKDKSGNFALANKQPMKIHEDIVIFYFKQPTYNKQKEIGNKPVNKNSIKNRSQKGFMEKIIIPKEQGGGNLERNPTSILKFNIIKHNQEEYNIHPTQKPVALFEYLIKTYTNEGELVLDNCMGSFTTAIACLNTRRNFIGIELDEHYFKVGFERLEKHLKTLDYTPEIVYNLK